METFENYIILIDGNNGVYIPYVFARMFKDQIIQQFDKQAFEDISDIESSLYWETWSDIVDNIEIEIDGIKHHLFEDGDLFAVPIEVNKA